ncbi:MAG: patatin-like phospholipase family protein, partial [bacterium]
DFFRPFFGGLVKEYNYVFVILPEGLNQKTMNIYTQCDQIFVLTDTQERVIYQTRLMINQLEEERGHGRESLKVILARLEEGEMIGTKGIEESLNYSISYKLPELPKAVPTGDQELVPYVTENSDHEYSKNIRRIARQIGNVSVGLALGAGAARGFAHIGVIKVLEEAGIVVDVVAGSSMGSLIGAVWASGATPGQMEEYANEFGEKGGLWSWSDLSFPPVKSIFRGHRVEKFLEHMMEGSTFSDTHFPIKLVSTDLETLKEVVIDSGSLVDGVRASISLPMVFEPVKKGDQTLVDGGVLSPVPVETLAGLGVSRIIAVNPIPQLDVLREHRHTRHVKDVKKVESWLTSLKKQIFPTGKGNIIDTFMRSLQTMQAQLAATACAEADVLLEPAVPTARWYEFDKPNKFIRQGEYSARKQLDEIKQVARPEKVPSE